MNANMYILIDANVTKEETNNTPKQGDVSIFLRDEHDILLLDVKLTKLRCNRRIMKIDSPNGIQLGCVKKGFVIIFKFTLT